MDYRHILFDGYAKTHADFLENDEKEKIEWFFRYARHNYLLHIDDCEKDNVNILEIGCNRGYLLRVLADHGYEKLFGIDLSPEDVESAKKLVPEAEIECMDALLYLGKRKAGFDLIVMKAVLEHVSKDDVLSLLIAINESLAPGGKLIVDVPNMDWLFATHERYMDFTHEVGFTRESLGQLMRQVFSSVEVIPVDHYAATNLSVGGKVRMVVSRYVLGRLLCWADPQTGECPIWERSILGLGIKK